MKQFRRLGEKTFFLDELFDWLKVPQTYNYGKFKQAILLPVQKELQEHTDLYFTFDEIKNGRAINALRFHIYSQERDFSGRKSLTVTVLDALTDAEESTSTPKERGPLHDVLREGITLLQGAPVYISWFEKAAIVETEGIIKIYFPTPFHTTWVRDHFQDDIESIFKPAEVRILSTEKNKEVA